MIWYAVPLEISNLIFVMLLITTAIQAANSVAAARELSRRREKVFIQLYGCLFILIIALFTFEMLLIISSIEGGIYFATDPGYRSVAIFAPLLYLYKKAARIDLPAGMDPLLLSFFVPLLRLPILDQLPMPLPVSFSIFAACWFFIDAVRTMWLFILFSRSQMTQNALSQIIQKISQGLCVSDQKGWILEYNPAFVELVSRIGIHHFETIKSLDESIRILSEDGKIRVSSFESGRLIQSEEDAFSLQISSFCVKRKKYWQIALSDVTPLTRTTRALEKENQEIEQKNQSLMQVLDQIEQETIAHQREHLCRTAHDLWSQRLTVAAFTVDVLLDEKKMPDNHVLEEICEQLSIPLRIDTDDSDNDLQTVLNRLSDMYRKLGVQIIVNGQLSFSARAQKALCAIVREALANAIRHSYAKIVTIDFFTDGHVKIVTINNNCLDQRPLIHEGRGIRDMITRATESGGLLRYDKNDVFTIQVIYPMSDT